MIRSTRNGVPIETHEVGVLQDAPRFRWGDAVERLVKPIAKAINSPCLEKDGTLKPKSPCRKMRDALNKL